MEIDPSAVKEPLDRVVVCSVEASAVKLSRR